MQTTYKGETVTLQRDAQKADPGFDPDLDQVVIIHADQSQSVVLRSDLGTKTLKALSKPQKLKLPSIAAIKHKQAKTKHRPKHRH